MGPKNACSYVDIVAEYIDKTFGRLRPFIQSWDRGLDFGMTRVQRLHAKFDSFNSFYAYLQFTTQALVGKLCTFSIFLLTTSNNHLETSMCNYKPTDANLYLIPGLRELR